MARRIQQSQVPAGEIVEPIDAEIVVDEAVVDEDLVDGVVGGRVGGRVVEARSAVVVPVKEEISTEARLIRGLFRVAGLAVGTVVHTAQTAAETTLDVGKQIARVALDGESQGDLVEFASNRLRELARDTLGLGGEPVREVVSYVPIAAPAGEAARATTAELRLRGDELLALSADVYYTDDIHPAFGMILDQLAPDEARILRYLALNRAQPIVDVRTNRPLGIGSELVGADLTSVPVQSGVRHIARARTYLINLARLGLVQTLADPVLLSRYMVLEVQPIVVEALARAGRSPKIVRKSLCLTDFGEDFCDTCFTLDRRPGRPAD